MRNAAQILSASLALVIVIVGVTLGLERIKKCLGGA